MALLIDRTLLRNALGYFSIYTTKMQTYLNVLENGRYTADEKTAAENAINAEILNFNKLINVIITKGGYTPTVDKFSDNDLRVMRIMP